VVLIQGLNQGRQSLAELTSELHRQGSDVVALDVEAEHGMMTVGEFQRVLSILSDTHCVQPDREIVWAGFSQGAVLLVVALPEIEVRCRQRVVLFAPPVSLRLLAGIGLEIAKLFPSVEWPSFSPGRLRFRSGVTGARYRDFDGLRRDVQILSPGARKMMTEAQVLMSSSDELVSPSGVRSWMEQNELPLKNFHVVSTAPERFDGLAHALYDRASCGRAAWEEVKMLLAPASEYGRSGQSR
jgi:hypothetical protein